MTVLIKLGNFISKKCKVSFFAKYIYEAKTKALNSLFGTMQLFCAYVFTYMQNAGFLMTWLIYRQRTPKALSRLICAMLFEYMQLSFLVVRLNCEA